MGDPKSDIDNTGDDRRNTGWGGKAESKTRDSGGKVPTIDGNEHTTGYGGKRESKAARDSSGTVPAITENDRSYSTQVSSTPGKSRRINDGVKHRR